MQLARLRINGALRDVETLLQHGGALRGGGEFFARCGKPRLLAVALFQEILLAGLICLEPGGACLPHALEQFLQGTGGRGFRRRSRFGSLRRGSFRYGGLWHSTLWRNRCLGLRPRRGRHEEKREQRETRHRTHGAASDAAGNGSRSKPGGCSPKAIATPRAIASS